MSFAPAWKILPLVCLAAAPAARAAEEAGGEHGKEDIGAVMLHHVSDGHTLELPGFCPGWSWGCEIDLDHAFGTVRDEATGKAMSGPLVLQRVDLTPTKHTVMMWVGSVLLLLVVLLATRRRALVPKGLYNFIEVLVAFVRNEIAVKNIGREHADRFVPYLLTAFFFILFLNLFGLVPWAATATANLSVTMMLAAFTFILTQAVAIREMGLGGFLAHLTGGVPKSLWPLWAIMIPVELLGLFTKPFALTVRLFANMVAGHFVILALLGLIFVISPWVAFGSVPMALAIFLLELFVAFVQAYIFTMLSSLFIGAGIEAAHHAHGEEAHAHAGPALGTAQAENGSHVAGASPGHG
jgi:F-type H+-transporting ATPase subunit a